MEYVKLIDICSPKQWKTVASSELFEDGYPVYGANGIIGYYHEYNHKDETLLITCRGATCGSLNISVPYAYINGNAMALDNLDSNKIDIKYLYYYLHNRGFADTISGSAQPQITRQGLDNVLVGLTELDVQKKIVQTLDTAQFLIMKRREQIEECDELIKSQFVEMFGNPNTNPRDWVFKPLSECLGNIENGKSFVCENSNRVGEFPAVLKLSAATYGIYKPNENKAVTNESLFVNAAEVHKGDLLFTRKNTPDLVGMCAFVYDTPPRLMMPDLIFRLNTRDNCNKIYLWRLINHELFREQIKNLASGSAQSMSNISKEKLMKLEIPLPPLDLQNQFATFAQQVDKLKFILQKSLLEIEDNFNALMQKAFNGELFPED